MKLVNADRKHAVLLVAALGFAFALAHSTRAATFRTVALAGKAAPGIANATFTDFMIVGSSDSRLVLNNAGNVGFYGTVAGPGITAANQSGIWSEGANGLRLVVREGTQAPGVPAGGNFSFGTPFSFQPEPMFCENGLAAFDAGLVGSVASNANVGIWSEGGGTLHLVGRKGSQAPGTVAGVVFDDLADPKVDATGRAAFLSTVTGTGVTAFNEYGIWSERSGTTQLLVRTGDPAPGTGDGPRFSGILEWNLNAAGRVVLRGTLTGTGVTNFNSEGVWTEGATGLNLVAREGSPPPGVEPGVSFSNFLSPTLSDAGHTSFIANLTGAGITQLNQMGIWTTNGQGLQLVARDGALAPGTAGDVRYTFFSPSLVNSVGQTAFRAQLGGTDANNTNNMGIWLSNGSAAELLVRKGTPAPGTAPGVVFDTMGDPELNANGQAAFYALVSGTDVVSTNNAGIWAKGAQGLELIAREGQLFEVAPGDQRTIMSLIFGTVGSNFRGMGFNDLGQLVFFASFSDGSKGIFVASVGIPEPTALVLVLLALVTLCANRNTAGGR